MTVLLLLVFGNPANGALASVTDAAGPIAAYVAGDVVAFTLDQATDLPVAGATIRLPAFNLVATSDVDGSFSFDVPIPTASPYRQITAIVTAPGYGAWTVNGLPLYPDITTLIHAELRSTPWQHQIDPPGLGPSESGVAAATGNTCTGWGANLVPPESIKVRLPDGTVKKYDFRFYVQHVLPSEWIPSWPNDALRAGAIAVKNVGWYRTLAGNARTGGSGCYDTDNNDQVFDPSYSTSSTDHAVNLTFGSVLWRSGGIFYTSYLAGSSTDPCAARSDGKMSQWGTKTCADQGVAWPQIVTTFYSNTAWNYLRDLLLNPSFEESPLYMWATTNSTSITRISATNAGTPAYEGTWWLKITNSGGTGTAWQTEPFSAPSTATYHAEAAFRCPSSNSTSCSITLKVVAITAGGATVEQSRSITEARDGLWRLYTFDTTSFGSDHAKIRLTVSSGQTINVDGLFLKRSG